MKLFQHENNYWFYCPACGHAHQFVAGGWTFNSDLERPTFRPSLKNTNHETVCHLHVTDGVIEYCPDCTHDRAGQNVPLGEFKFYEEDAMFKVVGQPVECSTIGSLPVIEDLIYYDGPLTFTSHCPDGTRLFVHAVDCYVGIDRYVVVEIDEATLIGFKANEIDFRTMLNRKPCWIVDCGIKGIERAWAVDFDSIPADYLPEAGVYFERNTNDEG